MGLAAFVDQTVAYVRSVPADPTRLPPEAITGALFAGAAGVAFFAHEMARLRGEDDLVPVARRWLDLAEAWARRATRADWKELPRGFLIGEAGIAYVDVLLSLREGDVVRALRASERIERLTERFDDLGRDFGAGDLVAGAGGAVCLARDLEGRVREREPGEADDHVTHAMRAIFARVKDRAVATVREVCAAPLAEDARLGFAHGTAGELWPLVQTLGLDDPVVQPRLAELAALREVDEEDFVFWLPARGQWAMSMVGSLCNGVAGQSLLWSEVARRSRSAESMELARRAAESTAFLGDTTPGICCGLAGQALALQRYADVSGDARFARRAYARLTRAAREVARTSPELMLGFWQGGLGVALVAAARLHGEASLPLIEPLASPR